MKRNIETRKYIDLIENPSAPMRPQDYSELEDWSGYYTSVLGKEPRQTLLHGMELFKNENIHSGLVVDIAAGEGRDSLALLGQGWKVFATDNHPEAFTHLWARVPETLKQNLKTQEVSFENMVFPDCQWINASYALPFCEPKNFEKLWMKITNAIQPGGRFTGQFFGNRDSWVSIPNRSHHTLNEVLQMFDEFTIESIHEEERNDPIEYRNPKHWHVFHVVAKKKH